MALTVVRLSDHKPVGVVINRRNVPSDSHYLSNFAVLGDEMKVRVLFTVWSIIAHEPKLHERFRHNNIFEVSFVKNDRFFHFSFIQSGNFFIFSDR